MRLAAALAALALFSVSDAIAQQAVDSLFLPTIANPAFAPGTGPVVLVDEGHFNAHVVEGSDRAFLEFLRRDGYRVRRSRSQFNRDTLNTGQILVIPMALSERNRVRGDSTSYFNPDSTDFDLPNPSAFSAEEITAVRGWVEDGGSLLLVSDHMPASGAVEDLALAFGIHFSNGHARDCRLPGGEISCGSLARGPFRRSDGSLADHPITDGRSSAERVDSVRTFGGSAFHPDRDNVDLEPLLVFRSGAISLEPTAFREFTPETPRIPVEGWFQGAALRFGEGRAVFFGEAGMFFAELRWLGMRTDEHEYGDPSPGAEQNPQFLLNVLHWLSSPLDERQRIEADPSGVSQY